MSRRELLRGASMLPLGLGGLRGVATAVAQAPGGARVSDPLPALNLPRVLPDKASFPGLRDVTYVDGSATHSRPEGANVLIRRAAAAEVGDAGGFRPNANRIRETFARLVNVDPSEIVFVPSTQIGESFIGNALGLQEKGAHVVSDTLHFVGSQEMYTDMAKRGLEVTWVHAKNNRIPMEDLDRAIVKGKTRLVAVSHTAFVTGFQHDLKRVSEIAHARGAMVYADIIQVAGNSPLDLADSGVDAACCATYKWLMSAGTAFLYVRKSSMGKMRPPFYHFSNYTRLLPDTHTLPLDKPGAAIVDNYETKPGAAGMFSMGYEPNPATLAGLEYSLPYLANMGLDRIQAHAQVLTDYLKQELPKKGYPLLTPVEAKSPIVTAVAADAQRLAPVLRAANIRATTRWNHVRFSPSVYNDMADMERVVRAMPRA